MEWNEWNGVEWNGIEMEWNRYGMNGIDGIDRWNGMDGIEWNRMEWNGIDR
jgi:hypothetical protein